MKMKIEGFHQIGVNRARFHLARHVHLRAGPHKDLERHSQHSICDHLLHINAKSAGPLSVENPPDPIDAIHPQKDQQDLREEIETVSSHKLKRLAGEGPENSHPTLASTVSGFP